MLKLFSKEVAVYVMAIANIAYAGSIVAKEAEMPPVKYVFPFEIVEQDGGYHAGDDLLVRIHFCVRPEYDKVYYNSITQSMLPTDGGSPIFMDTITDRIIDKHAWSGAGIVYTDMDGYRCIQAYGEPKRIPFYAPPGCYNMHFAASVNGKRSKHTIIYESKEFCI